MPVTTFVIGISSPTRGQVVTNLTNGYFSVLPDQTKPTVFVGVFRVLNTGRDRLNNTYYIVQPYIPVELGSYMECVIHTLNMGKKLNPRFDLAQLRYTLDVLSTIPFEHQTIVAEASNALSGYTARIARQDRHINVEDIFGLFQFERLQYAVLYVVTELALEKNRLQYADLFQVVENLKGDT